MTARRFSFILVVALGFAAGAAAQPVAQPLAATGDTVLVKQVAEEPSVWGRITSIASGLMTITVMILAAALVPAAWNLRKNHKMIRHTLEKLEQRIDPLITHANSIADDVHYVTTAVRADVHQAHQLVAEANRRLLGAMEKAEERVNDFNALLEVAQEEAEATFITTASTIRGVKVGAKTLVGNGRRRRGGRDRELREKFDELRAAIDEDLEESVHGVGPALDESFAQEDTDGHDGRSRPDGRS